MLNLFVIFRIDLSSSKTNFTAVFIVSADVWPKLIPVLFFFRTIIFYKLARCNYKISLNN